MTVSLIVILMTSLHPMHTSHLAIFKTQYNIYAVSKLE